MERQHRAEEALKVVEEKEARLDALCAQVAPEVVADPQRLLQPTAAWSQHEEAQAGGICPDGGFAVHGGYSVDELMKDQRFKVGLALQEAGLTGSDYARQVLKSIPTAKPMRTDMMTSEEKAAAASNVAR